MLEVHGLTSERRSASSPPSAAIVLHELTPQQASLEEAFMRLTRDAVEYHADRPAVEPVERRMSAAVARRGRPASRGRVTQLRVAPLGVDEAVVAALDALVAARRRDRAWPASASSSPPCR